jgi:hypothetical protein
VFRVMHKGISVGYFPTSNSGWTSNSHRFDNVDDDGWRDQAENGISSFWTGTRHLDDTGNINDLNVPYDFALLPYPSQTSTCLQHRSYGFRQCISTANQ